MCLVILITISCKEEREENFGSRHVSRPLIRIDDYEIDSVQFQKKLIDLSNNGVDFKDAHIALFDNIISAGLLIEESRKLGYDNDTNILQRLNSIKRDIQVKYIVEKRASRYLLTTKEIEKLLTRYTDKLIIDYIWVPDGYRDIYDDILEKFEKNEDIDVLTTNSKATEWKEAGVKFFKGKPIKVGTLFQKLFVEIYNLRSGELFLKRTKSGYHLIRLIHRLKDDKKVDKYKIEATRIDLAIATAKENGDLLADAERLINEVWIDHEILYLINFGISPLIKSNLGEENGSQDSIIAEFKGKKISKKNLIKDISGHSGNIQGLFNNRSTRKLITAALIMRKEGYEPFDINAKRELEEFIKKSISDHTNKLSTRTDSVQFLSDWFDNLLFKFPHESLLGILCKQSSRCRNKFSDSIIARTLINSDLSKQKKHLKVNFRELESMKTFQNSSINQHIIAFGDNWKLSVEDFKSDLRRLTPRTRIAMTRKDNAVKLIRYMATGSAVDSNAVKIDYGLLDSIDLIGYSMDSLRQFNSESNIVGKLRNIEITVEGLRLHVSTLTGKKREDFLSMGTRAKACKEFIIREYIIQNDSSISIEEEKNLTGRLRKYKYQLMVEALYKNEIRIEHVNLRDNQINYVFGMAIKNLEQNRLEEFLINAAKEQKIEVNIEIARAMGITPSQSSYAMFIDKIHSNSKNDD